MSSKHSKRIWISALVGLVVVEALAVGYLGAREYWRGRAEGTAVVRGRAVAEKLGCFGCHGPGGAASIPNPGALGGKVPMWTGGTWMMYNSAATDVRAWVLDGHPPDREPDAGALIPMPAYRGEVSDDDLDDLVAYVLAVAQFGQIDDQRAAAGRRVANRFGCFGCHGPEGRGLIENPLSFKGYIPAWDGDDYVELVQGPDEFRQWVKHGVSDRFRDNPAARAFVDRQIVPMPAFGDLISDEEIDQLYAYVQWVRANPR
jgi:mono/diheme cytochrome c family protein